MGKSLDKVFLYTWVGWGILLLLAEFLFPQYFWVCLIYFAIAEGVAVKRKKKGDTLSEHVWAFYGGNWGRLPFIVGFALWIMCRATNVDTDFAHGDIITWLGRMFLVLGIGSWLVIHFAWRGKHG